jgi:hypothetical protein
MMEAIARYSVLSHEGVLQFEVRENLMQGTMTLPDGTLWRKLSLKKVQ